MLLHHWLLQSLGALGTGVFTTRPLQLEVGELHVDDVGADIQCEFVDLAAGAYDCGDVVLLEMIAEKPDGTSVAWPAEFINDGSDGLAHYVTADGDLDQAGLWYFQGRLTFADAVLHSERVRRRVFKNNAEPAP